MSATRKKLGAPVRTGQWGLNLDRLNDPQTVTILKYADKSRHTRSFSEIGTFAYDGDLESLGELVSTHSEMPSTTARTLARNLIAKANSPRATEVDAEP